MVGTRGVFFFIVGVMLVSGCISSEEKVITMTQTRYQCYDGSVVSSLNKCPKSTSNTIPRVTTAITSVTTPSGVACPPCRCTTTTLRPATTTTIYRKPCTYASECGQESAVSRCKADGWYEIRYTPTCTDGYCLFNSTMTLKQECTGDEYCNDEKGCVQRSS